MALDHKSCLGIVDNTGKLIGSVSISDLRFVGSNNYGLLMSTVAEFSVIINGKGPSAEEAIKGTRVAVSAGGGWAEAVAPGANVLLA